MPVPQLHIRWTIIYDNHLPIFMELLFHRPDQIFQPILSMVVYGGQQ
jgi:hypothetical protein